MTSIEHFDQWCKNELAEGRDHYALSAWAAWQASRAQALDEAAKLLDAAVDAALIAGRSEGLYGGQAGMSEQEYRSYVALRQIIDEKRAAIRQMKDNK